MDRFVAGRYDLLVTDLRLPGHDGDVMARALRSVDPSMPTLLITGEDLSEGGNDFCILRDPWSRLQQTLRQGGARW